MIMVFENKEIIENCFLLSEFSVFVAFYITWKDKGIGPYMEDLKLNTIETFS